MQASTIAVRLMQGALALCLVLPLAAVPAPARPLAKPGVALDTASLKTIAAWLMQSGRDGYLAADVADAAGIPRERTEEALEAKQRGFRTGEVLRIAQVSADGRHEFLLFMVQRPEGEVYFFHASVREGLKKAFVSVPRTGAVLVLEVQEARAAFQGELSYWEARIAGL